MTESEWLSSDDPDALLRHVRPRTSPRKLRLFAVALCRRLRAHFDPEDNTRKYLRLAERVADGHASPDRLYDTVEEALEERDGRAFLPPSDVDWAQVDLDSWAAAELARACVAEDEGEGATEAVAVMLELAVRKAVVGEEGSYAAAFDGTMQAWDRRCELAEALRPQAEQPARAMVCRWVREIWGNPFRPVRVAPGWLTPAVKRLAGTIYEERAFADLPVLADALTDAGCDSKELLGHCRGRRKHERGCWLLDALLGQE